MTEKEQQIKKPKNYFTILHEQAIIDYIKTTDSRKRNELYVTIIQPAFHEMIKKIVYRYKFFSLPNIDSLIQECESHLVTILSKFDESKGSKAFSYFSVITKNWFIHKVKKNVTQIIQESQHEDISSLIEHSHLSTVSTYYEDRTSKEYLESLWQEISKWECLKLNDNEKKVLMAIKILLAQPDAMEIINKKSLYVYIREITNLNTKQILIGLNKFRILYIEFNDKWRNEEN